MPRVTFSNELNDFVKGFTAGSAIYDAAEDRKIKREKNQIDRDETAAKSEYYRALAKRYGGGGDETAPFIDEGIERFGPGGAGSPAAIPAAETPATGKIQPPAFLNAVNEKYPALPPGYLSNNAYIESKYDPNAHAKGSSAAGMFQFTDGTAKRYGLTNRYDALKSAEATGQMATDDSKVLAKFLKRAPTGGELYLAHQQGATGALRLLQNPDTPAVALVGRDQVVNNGGHPDMTGREFANMWLRKWEAAKSKHAALDVDAPSQLAAHGGMIRHYEDGGAVPTEQAPQDKPYYINDLMDDVGSAMGKLGEVVHAGLQGLQEKFGLNERPAVAEADPDYNNRVAAFVRNDGVPPPEQVEALRSKVDPDNRLGVALGTTYGMVKAYDHYLAKGDVKAAQGVATSLIQYTKAQSQQLGALAVEAIKAGDTTSAAKALAQAYNAIPNGKEATVEGNKVTITDERTGKVIEQKEFTPDMLLNAAMGMTTGKAYLDDLSQFAASEKMQIAEGKNQTAVQIAGMKTQSAEKIADENNQTKTNIAELRTRSAERIKRLGIDAISGENDKKIAAQKELKQMGIDANVVLKQMGIDAAKATAEQKIEAWYGLRQMIIDAHSEDTDKRLQARKDLKQMDIDADLALQDDKQQGAVDLEGVKQGGRSALESQKQTGRETLADKNNASREGIAAGNNASREAVATQNNQTRRDEGMANREVKLSEGEANRNNRSGIAAENRALRQSEGAANRDASMDRTKLRTDTSTANTQTRVDAAGQRQDKSIAARSAQQDKALTAAQEKEQRANAEFDRRQGAKGVTGRQTKEIDRVDKMSDHMILGADEAVTPKVSAAQAQATRNIARGILEAGGDKYGDSAVSIARKLTAFDPSTRSLKTNFKLSEGKDGYAVTLPDGSRVPLNENGYRELKRIQDMAGARR